MTSETVTPQARYLARRKIPEGECGYPLSWLYPWQRAVIQRLCPGVTDKTHISEALYDELFGG